MLLSPLSEPSPAQHTPPGAPLHPPQGASASAASGKGPPSSQGAGTPAPSLALALAAQSSPHMPFPPGVRLPVREAWGSAPTDGLTACGPAVRLHWPWQPGGGGHGCGAAVPRAHPSPLRRGLAHLPPWGLSLPAVLPTLLLPENPAAHTLRSSGGLQKFSPRVSASSTAVKTRRFRAVLGSELPPAVSVPPQGLRGHGP